MNADSPGKFQIIIQPMENISKPAFFYSLEYFCVCSKSISFTVKMINFSCDCGPAKKRNPISHTKRKIKRHATSNRLVFEEFAIGHCFMCTLSSMQKANQAVRLNLNVQMRLETMYGRVYAYPVHGKERNKRHTHTHTHWNIRIAPSTICQCTESKRVLHSTLWCYCCRCCWPLFSLVLLRKSLHWCVFAW